MGRYEKYFFMSVPATLTCTAIVMSLFSTYAIYMHKKIISDLMKNTSVDINMINGKI